MIFMFFIFILNVVAIALTYYCLSDTDKKTKLIFIAVGIAIIYVGTTITYWLSTKEIAVKEVSELGKNLITFLFVPINAIIVLPIMAKSYYKYKEGRLQYEHLRNRGIVLAVVLIILLIVECMYFKDIQNTVVKFVQEQQNSQEETNTVDVVVDGNYIQNTNDLSNNTNENISGDVSNVEEENISNEVSSITNESASNEVSNVADENISSNVSNRVEENTGSNNVQINEGV